MDGGAAAVAVVVVAATVVVLEFKPAWSSCVVITMRSPPRWELRGLWLSTSS